jgi:hypothetical protein
MMLFEYSLTIQTTSEIPHLENVVSSRCINGTPLTGTRGFGIEMPSALKRLPSPAAMIPAFNVQRIFVNNRLQTSRSANQRIFLPTSKNV